MVLQFILKLKCAYVCVCALTDKFSIDSGDGGGSGDSADRSCPQMNNSGAFDETDPQNPTISARTLAVIVVLRRFELDALMRLAARADCVLREKQ